MCNTIRRAHEEEHTHFNLLELEMKILVICNYKVDELIPNPSQLPDC